VHELKGFFFGNFSLPSKKNCPAQYEDKLRNKCFLSYIVPNWHFLILVFYKEITK